MSEFLKTHMDDHVLHIILHRGKSNAMHLEMIQEITETFHEATTNPAIEGVVLTGHEGFFTSGLDLITLYGYNETEMEQFWQAFMDMLHQLVAFPKPFVTAISGHSPAGGCVMAIAADARVMAEGEYIIGLNEVPVGIIVPHGIFNLYSFWIGEAQAYRFLLEGKLLTPQQALQVGLVDEVVPLDKIQRSAVRHIKKYAQLEKNAWQRTKLNMRSKLMQSLEANKQETITEMLTQWWKPSTRAILKTVIDNLTSKKK